MRKLLGLAIVAGGITLAVLIGQRMSTDAMAVVVGVVFGVAASIPTSLLIVAATQQSRHDPYRSLGPDPKPNQQQPQIYIVNPGSQPAPSVRPQLPEPPAFSVQLPQRRYTVVGDEDNYDD